MKQENELFLRNVRETVKAALSKHRWLLIDSFSHIGVMDGSQLVSCLAGWLVVYLYVCLVIRSSAGTMDLNESLYRYSWFLQCESDKQYTAVLL